MAKQFNSREEATTYIIDLLTLEEYDPAAHNITAIVDATTATDAWGHWTIWASPEKILMTALENTLPAETTTLTAVTEAIATTLDMDTDAAETIARTYLAQISDIDGQPYDDDALPTDAAEFIIEAARRAQPDLTVLPLGRVAEAAEQATQAKDTLTLAREERDAAVLAALDAGAVLAQVARAACLSRQAIYNLQGKR